MVLLDLAGRRENREKTKEVSMVERLEDGRTASK
jgi:hypothetical protein